MCNFAKENKLEYCLKPSIIIVCQTGAYSEQYSSVNARVQSNKTTITVYTTCLIYYTEHSYEINN